MGAIVASLTISGVGRGDNRVPVIGIDGAGGNYTEAAHAPHLDALAADGAARYDWLNEAARAFNPLSPQ